MFVLSIYNLLYIRYPFSLELQLWPEQENPLEEGIETLEVHLENVIVSLS